jgi:hypothetical protein
MKQVPTMTLNENNLSNRLARNFGIRSNLSELRYIIPADKVSFLSKEKKISFFFFWWDCNLLLPGVMCLVRLPYNDIDALTCSCSSPTVAPTPSIQ